MFDFFWWSRSRPGDKAPIAHITLSMRKAKTESGMKEIYVGFCGAEMPAWQSFGQPKPKFGTLQDAEQDEAMICEECKKKYQSRPLKAA